MQTYSFPISTTCPNGLVNTSKLQIAIANSTISSATIQDINTSGDTLNIDFSAPLLTGEVSALDTLVATTDSTDFSNAVYGNLGERKGLLLTTTADQPIFMTSKRYIIRRISAQNIQGGLAALAAGGIYTGPNKTGSLVVAATQLYSGLSTNAKFIDLLLTGTATGNVLTSNELYFALTVAIGTGVSLDVSIWGEDYSADYGD